VFAVQVSSGRAAQLLTAVPPLLARSGGTAADQQKSFIGKAKLFRK